MSLLGAGGMRAWCLLGLGLSVACGTTDQNPKQTPGGASGAAGATANGGAGGGSSGATSGGGAGTSGESTGGVAGHTGGATSGGGAESGDARGTVQVGQLFGTTPRFEASARFSAKDAEAESDCVRETFGDCSVSTCTPNGKTATPAPYAGTIKLSDGADIDLELTTTPGENYASQSPSGASLSGAELITVTAAGAEVPAFTTEVAVPLVITISGPMLDEKGMASAPASGDLVLTFDNRSADGETETKLVASASSAQSSLYCVLPTETGTATIAAAALAKVRGGQLRLITARSKQLTAGAFNISVIAYISAMTPDKSSPAIFNL